MKAEIVIRQNRQYETEILPTGHHQPVSNELQLEGFEYSLTPDGLLLASLGSCTALVLHKYAQNHNLKLDTVEVHLRIERIAQEKNKDPKMDDKPHNRIQQYIKLIGGLDPEIERRVYLICRHCSISSILEQGVEVESYLVDSNT